MHYEQLSGNSVRATAFVAATVPVSVGLTVNADEPPSHHAAIRGWRTNGGEARAHNDALAKQIAAEAEVIAFTAGGYWWNSESPTPSPTASRALMGERRGARIGVHRRPRGPRNFSLTSNPGDEQSRSRTVALGHNGCAASAPQVSLTRTRDEAARVSVGGARDGNVAARAFSMLRAARPVSHHAQRTRHATRQLNSDGRASLHNTTSQHHAHHTGLTHQRAVVSAREHSRHQSRRNAI